MRVPSGHSTGVYSLDVKQCKCLLVIVQVFIRQMSNNASVFWSYHRCLFVRCQTMRVSSGHSTGVYSLDVKQCECLLVIVQVFIRQMSNNVSIFWSYHRCLFVRCQTMRVSSGHSTSVYWSDVKQCECLLVIVQVFIR